MKIKEITDVIERFAPLDSQEGYDNAGLVVGRPDDEVHKALVAVDVTEAVLDEAEQLGCDLVVTHHPLIFHPLKRLNSADHTQRCVERAIRKKIALYACHTNLDKHGLSDYLAREIGLTDRHVLQPESGYGVVGELPGEVDAEEFLRKTMRRLQIEVIRHSDLSGKNIRRVALSTGAGGSLIADARRAGADLYLTADLKYNDFMAPEGIVVADIGHFESEYCAIDLLCEVLLKNLSNFVACKSVNSRNPVNYIL